VVTRRFNPSVIVAATLAASLVTLGAQDQGFEVASVKHNTSGDTDGELRQLPGGRMVATNMLARQIILFAYNIAGSQLIGAPSWLRTERYDMAAKMDGNPAIELVRGDNGGNPMQLALRALLEDRFKLKMHREMREMDIYALVMAGPGGGPGPNLKRTVQDCAAAAASAQRGQAPPDSNAPFCGVQVGGPGRIRLGGLPSSAFVKAFIGPSGRYVIDRTGLSGNWDWELTFVTQAEAPDRTRRPPIRTRRTSSSQSRNNSV